MSKAVKAMITAELRERYSDVSSVCVVDLTGLNVQQQEKLRRDLGGKSSRLEVVKNTLARRAFRDTQLAPIGEVLEGPCALVTTTDSPIEMAKVLVRAAEDFVTLNLKEAMIDGDPSLVTVERLSKMLGRTELLRALAALISAPAGALTACLASPQAKIAGCLKTIAEKDAA